MTTTKPTGDTVTIALHLRFNDAMTLGLNLATVIRTGNLDDGTRRAFHRVYDAVARTGAVDWGVGIDRLLPWDGT